MLILIKSLPSHSLVETNVQFGRNLLENAYARGCVLLYFRQDAARVWVWAYTVRRLVSTVLPYGLARLICVFAVTAILWQICIICFPVVPIINIKILFFLSLPWDTSRNQVRNLTENYPIVELAEIVYYRVLPNFILEGFDPLHDHLLCRVVDFKVFGLIPHNCLACLTSKLRALILQLWEWANRLVVVAHGIGVLLLKNASTELFILFSFCVVSADMGHDTFGLRRII